MSAWLVMSAMGIYQVAPGTEDYIIGTPWFDEVKVNLEQMMRRKSSVVEQTTKGINYLMDKNNITVFQGVGSFVDTTHIKIINYRQQC